MERLEKDEYYLDIAIKVAARSSCLKRHYGCVIVKNDEIIATGYNGAPRGEENCCDRGKCRRIDAPRYSDYNMCPAVHAEQNAMLEAARKDMIGATMYLACKCENELGEFTIQDLNPEPCNICKAMIKNAEIERIVNRKGDVTWG